MPLLTASSSRRPTIIAAVGLVGFTAIIGQIILMRELIVVFSGNEVSLGIMLAVWLVWTAAGSGLASHIALTQTKVRSAMAILECLLGLTLPITIWAVRASRSFFQTVPGELIGPGPMLLTCLICLSGFCFLSGSLFVVVARMYQQGGGASASLASSSAYLFEGAGSALGGTVASLVLLRFLDAFHIATVVALLNFGMAAILMFTVNRRRFLAAFLVTCALAFPLLMYVAPLLRASSLERLWQGFRLLESRDSIYGNLAVTETGSIRSIYDNGVILASAPDEAAAEEAVHYALLEHPAPGTVLLIGGGASGGITQVLKHPTIRRLDYVELDPALVDIARQFFATQSAFLSDPRVRVHFADGRQYLTTVHDQFDVVILDLPDPQSAQLNRFYTVEFFRSIAEHLAPAGLLAFQVRASEDYISPERAEFLRCIYLTLRQVFPYASVIPGESMHFLAAMRPEVVTDDPQVLMARLQARNLQTRYVREYFIPFRMMPDRMLQIRRLLKPTPATPVNRDFTPVAYFFDVMLWGAQFKGSHYGWFWAAAHLRFARVLTWTTIPLLCAALALAYWPRRENRVRAAVIGCAAATGFTLMTLQLFLLLAFQSVYGYVYHQLAILVGMFMAGIALGSWLGIERVRAVNRKPLVTAVSIVQFALALAGLLLLALISWLARGSGNLSSLVAPQLLFPMLAVLCGMLGGYQFPLASEIYLGDSKNQKGLGILYAVDLLGGCVGALLLSSYLIPVFGFWKTAGFSAAVNLPAVLLAARVSLGSGESPA